MLCLISAILNERGHAMSHLSHSEWTGAPVSISTWQAGAGFNFNMNYLCDLYARHVGIDYTVLVVFFPPMHGMFTSTNRFVCLGRIMSLLFLWGRGFFFSVFLFLDSQCFFFFFFLQLVLVGLVPHCAGSRNYLNEGTLSKRHGHHWPNDTLPWLSKLPD